MIRRICLISLLAMFVLLSGIGVSAAKGDALQIAVPMRSFTYVVSPDGATAAVYHVLAVVREVPPSAEATIIRIVDLATGEIIQTLDDLSDWVSDAAYLPDGRLLTVHANGDFILWDVASGEQERQWWSGFYWSRIRLSSDGSKVYLMTWGISNTFFEIDLETGIILRALGRHPATLDDLLVSQGDSERRGDYQFTDFALSPDGTSLAYANANGEIFVTDLASELFTLARERSERPLLFSIRSMRFAPDSASLFYQHVERDMRNVMHVAPNSAPIASYGEDVAAYAVSPDGSRIAWVERGEDISRVIMQDNASGDTEVVYDLPQESLAVAPLATLNFTADGSRLLLDVSPANGDDGQGILLVIPIG